MKPPGKVVHPVHRRNPRKTGPVKEDTENGKENRFPKSGKSPNEVQEWRERSYLGRKELKKGMGTPAPNGAKLVGLRGTPGT